METIKTMETIVFVHGIAGSKKHYQPMIKFLKSRGIDKFLEFEYESRIGLTPIKEIAAELAEFIERNTGENEISIISFSQGGIIALAYLKYYANKNIKKVFTVATPHKGSVLAKILNWPGFLDMRPNSPLLSDLENYCAKECSSQIFSIFTPFDLMAFPGWSAKCSRGKTKMVLAPTHMSSFYWKPTFKFIYKNLK